MPPSAASQGCLCQQEPHGIALALTEWEEQNPTHLVGSGAGIAAHPVTLAGNPYCPLAAPSLLRKRGTGLTWSSAMVLGRE